MISLIEALNYRCLYSIKRPLGRFHALVGPNASGKTSFLDIVAFLGQLVSEGLEAAVRTRTDNFQDLVWGRKDIDFELAIEAEIPADLRQHLSNPAFNIVRYEVAVGLDPQTQEAALLAEKVLLKEGTGKPPQQRDLFPMIPAPPETILTPQRAQRARTVINKVTGGNDNFYSEVYPAGGKGWAPAFKLGPRKSALGNLPADETRFPVSTWLKNLLTEGVQQFVLNSQLIRKASPPGQGKRFKPDGSNLPWVIESLCKTPDKTAERRFQDWLAHLRTALPDLADIRTVERQDDKHKYLMIRYDSGFELPSWMVSDGTLRLLALTLPPYLTDFSGVYLIEEPENGVHPRAVETMIQSLSSVYDAQILLATHSPVILSILEPDDVLCFAKTEEGATDIIRGSEHPKLKAWRGEENLGVLFASGVLG